MPGMDATPAALRCTPLHDRHLALKARMAPFGGFDMPIQYTGILQEHLACRQGVAIFDTCHMGEFHIAGPSARADLERLVSCPLATLAVGQCRYGLLCNPEGGVMDDLIVYRLADADYLVVVNAGTQDADFAWMRAHLSPSTRAENQSATTAKLDIQGPASPRLLNRLLESPITDLRYYRFHHNRFGNRPVLVSRTGYTGEIGFEVYGDADSALALWDACIANGAVPAGLGARDTLRLEVGLPLYGQELDASRNAAESGFASAISPTNAFIGAAAVRDPTRRRQTLAGIALEGRRAARAGDTVLGPDHAPIGTVTSGSFAPSLGSAIALGYLDLPHAQPEATVLIQTARDTLPGRVTKPPFYRDGSVRRDTASLL